MFRILSIDGGGARGIYPAHFLHLFSKQYGQDLTQIFDLIIGTSTGAIIAAAAATHRPMADVVKLYEAKAASIFRKRISFRGILRSKYTSTVLREELVRMFDDTTLGQVPGKLILPATDLSNGNVFVLKSKYLPEFVRDVDILLADALMASCAAPSYFDPVRIGPYLLADGGLWGNNPSWIAYTEAVGKLGVPAEEIRLLSIGTGTGHQFYDVGRRTPWWGLSTGWKHTRLVDTFLNLQSRASSNTATLLLRDKYYRVSFDESGPLSLDDTKAMPRFKAKADEAFTYQNAKIKTFLNL